MSRDSIEDFAVAVTGFYYGSVSADVMRVLFRCSLSTLPNIQKELHQPLSKVCSVLANLIRFRLVVFDSTRFGPKSIVYEPHLKMIASVVKYASFVNRAAKLYGVTGGRIVSSLVTSGVSEKRWVIEEDSLDGNEVFEKMVEDRFLRKMSAVDDAEFYHLDINEIEHVEMLEEIVKGYRVQFNDKVGLAVEAIVKNRVSFDHALMSLKTESMNAAGIARNNAELSLDFLDAVMGNLCRDESSSIEHELGSTSEYFVNLHSALTNLYEQQLGSTITHKYDEVAAQVVSAVRHYRRMRKERIEQVLLIEPKQASKYVVSLCRDQILHLHEYPRFRTNDIVAEKCEYYISLDDFRAANVFLAMFYKSIANLITFVQSLLDSRTAVGGLQFLLEKEASLEGGINANSNTPEQPLSDTEKDLVMDFWKRYRKLNISCSKLGIPIRIFEAFLLYNRKQSPLGNLKD